MLASGHPIPFSVASPLGGKLCPLRRNLVQFRRGLVKSSLETAVVDEFLAGDGNDSDWSLSPNPPDVEPAMAATGKFSAESDTKALTTGLGRLKAKRVKAIVKKNSWLKREIGTNDD